MSQSGLFSAAESAVGYLFQCRLALLYSIRNIRSGTFDAVSIETLDDVTFDTNGSPAELLQTKHRGREAALTDKSTDLWKTIRVWIDFHQTTNTPIGDVALTLVTTARLKVEDAVAYLTAALASRDVSKAVDLLDAAASSTVNQEVVKAVTLYNGLARSEKEALFGAVTIIGSHENIIDIDSELKRELLLSVRAKHLNAFLEVVEGWWFRWCVTHLAGTDRAPMAFSAIQERLVESSEQFEADNLPVDVWSEPDTMDIDNDTRVFVLQLKEIGLTNRAIEQAVRNYYRAFENRSRWNREDLLLVGELQDYEKKLIEEWEQLFEIMKIRIGEGSTEEQAKAHGFDLFSELHFNRHWPIRPRVTEESIMRGSFHMLADDLRVGWHLSFRERLEHLLEVAVR